MYSAKYACMRVEHQYCLATGHVPRKPNNVINFWIYAGVEVTILVAVQPTDGTGPATAHGPGVSNLPTPSSLHWPDGDNKNNLYFGLVKLTAMPSVGELVKCKGRDIF